MYTIEECIKDYRVGPSVADRMRRLNPYDLTGRYIRGHFIKTSYRYPWTLAVMPRGEVIRKHGRAAVDKIPRTEIVKRGRRQYVTLRAVASIIPSN